MRHTDRRQLERSCRAKIAELDLPAPLRLGELKERLETHRGREMWVLPDHGQLPVEITGLWIGTSTRDYVYFRSTLVGFRLEQTLLHEFAHMICRHRSASIDNQTWLRERAPGLASAENIVQICMRTDYGSPDEHEAELMASLILARSTNRGRADMGALQPDEVAAHRVQSIFQT